MLTHNYRSGVQFVLRHSMKHWYLFLISGILFFGGAYYYSHRIHIGETEYFSQMAIRKAQGIKIPVGESRVEFLFSSYRPEWEKESWLKANQLDKILMATETMEIAGRKVNYDMRYSIDAPKNRQDIYNQTPIQVRFLDTHAADACSMRVSWNKNGSLCLSNFSGKIGDQTISNLSTVTTSYYKETSTPIGRVLILPENPQNHFPYSTGKRITSIWVEKISEETARLAIDPHLEVHFTEDNSHIRFNLESTLSERLCIDFLNSMMTTSDSIVKAKIQEEVLEYRGLIEKSLAALDTVEGGGTKQEVRHDLETRLFRTYADEQIIHSNQMLSVLDHGRISQRLASSKLLYLWAFLFTLIVPLALITILYFYKDSLFDLDNLSRFWKKRIIGSMPLSRKSVRKDLNYWDAIRCRLLEESHSNKLFIVSSPSPFRYSDLWVEQCAQNIELTGKKVCTIKLLPEGKTAQKSSKYNALWTLKPGWVGSPACHQEIQELYKRFDIILIETPSPLRYPNLFALQEMANATLYLIDHENTQAQQLARLEIEIESRETREPQSGSSHWAVWLQ